MKRLAFFVFAVCALLLSACHGDQNRARTALDIAARGLVAVDDEVAPRYTAAASEAYTVATDRADYEARMRPWNRAEEAIRVASASLVTAEISLQAGQKGADVLGCVGLALTQVLAALDAVRVSIPSAVRGSIETLAAARGAACIGAP